jgi:hypothetical protein
MLATLGRVSRPAALAAVACVLSVGSVVAQLGDPTGPGQPVPIPPAQCPATVSCQYAERNYLPDGYRVQMLQVCGANCSSQYWVSDVAGGQALLTIDPVPNALIAIGRGADPQDAHPPVRTILPDYAASDPRCCPSQYRDTTYTWDSARGALVMGAPVTIPAAEFGGWDAARAGLESEQFSEVFPRS